ncbi:MAG: glycosyltransferase family 2 protein [Alphaproteobacteria bacterium]
MSVVVPAFNAERTLAAALESIPADPWPPIEVIVVDDASTDATRAVAEAFGRRRAGVKLAALPQNRGPGAARNTGMRLARGAFVGFLDADDRYGPRFVTELLELFLVAPEAAVAASSVRIVDCPLPIHPLQLHAIAQSLPCNILVRREAAELVGGFPEDPAFRGPTGGEDVAFRTALRRHFVERRQATAAYLHRYRAGGHLERYLRQTEFRDGKIVFASGDGGEDTAALIAAKRSYEAAAGRRLFAARKLARD